MKSILHQINTVVCVYTYTYALIKIYSKAYTYKSTSLYSIQGVRSLVKDSEYLRYQGEANMYNEKPLKLNQSSKCIPNYLVTYSSKFSHFTEMMNAHSCSCISI